MLGTIVNTLAIIAGSLVGLLLRGGIPAQYKQTIIQALSLAVILIGLKGALQTDAILLVIFSMVVGTVAGELLRIEDRLEGFGRWIESRLATGGNGIAKGFVTASLVYCVGSMAIVGSLESGLTGNHQTLFAKSVLDGVSAIIFASSLGAGVLFSAVSVLLYQGGLTLGAAFMKQFLIPATVSQMSAVGGLLIMAIGINLQEIQRIMVGNMLPAVYMPLLYYMLRQLL